MTVLFSGRWSDVNTPKISFEIRSASIDTETAQNIPCTIFSFKTNAG